MLEWQKINRKLLPLRWGFAAEQGSLVIIVAAFPKRQEPATWRRQLQHLHINTSNTINNSNKNKHNNKETGQTAQKCISTVEFRKTTTRHYGLFYISNAFVYFILKIEIKFCKSTTLIWRKILLSIIVKIINIICCSNYRKIKCLLRSFCFSVYSLALLLAQNICAFCFFLI